MMHLTSVDLPAPFSPSSAWNEPAGMSTLTLSSAVIAPNRLVMPIACSEGAVRDSVAANVISFRGSPETRRPPHPPFGPLLPEGRRRSHYNVSDAAWSLGERRAPSAHRGEGVRP